MSDLIPDKAFMVAATALWGTPAGDAVRVARTAVEAAAPIIARAAQAQILRELLAADPYDVHTGGVEAWVNHRIWELESTP